MCCFRVLLVSLCVATGQVYLYSRWLYELLRFAPFRSEECGWWALAKYSDNLLLLTWIISVPLDTFSTLSVSWCRHKLRPLARAKQQFSVELSSWKSSLWDEMKWGLQLAQEKRQYSWREIEGGEGSHFGSTEFRRVLLSCAVCTEDLGWLEMKW